MAFVSFRVRARMRFHSAWRHTAPCAVTLEMDLHQLGRGQGQKQPSFRMLSARFGQVASVIYPFRVIARGPCTTIISVEGGIDIWQTQYSDRPPSLPPSKVAVTYSRQGKRKGRGINVTAQYRSVPCNSGHHLIKGFSGPALISVMTWSLLRL